MSFKDYRKRVEQLAKERTGEPISNGSLDHASVIIEQMFRSAKDHVWILSGNLNARAYGRDDVLEQARLFLAHGKHHARILVEEVDDTMLTEHPFIVEFYDNENVEFRTVSPSMLDQYEYHFLVMDEDCYRFEPQKDEPTAVASFGDSETAKHLAVIYDVIWEESDELLIPAKEDIHPTRVQ